jgi:hypothetical protein
LAHAVLYAEGESRSTDRTLHRWFDPVENMADEIMEIWGFDPNAMDTWMQENWTWPTEKRARSKKRK